MFHEMKEFQPDFFVYEDGSGDDGQAMETDSLEDLRVRCRKSAVLFTVLTVALIACNM